MRYSIFFAFVLIGSMAGGFLACQTDTVPAAQTGSLGLTFDNVAGSQDLVLNTGTYQNAAGEPLVVTRFNYFVSNIRLKKDDGSEYVVPQDNSYFLVEEERPASQTITLSNIPVGNYTGLTFLIGVDSLRSLADISKRTGPLDPGLTTHDPMYWEWNSGYIFMKLEGTSMAAPAAQNNLFYYHVGGFGGGYNGKKTLNNLRTVTIPFAGEVASVKTDAKPVLRIKTDVLKVFNGPTPLRIADHSSVMFEPFSTSIADNYVQMFRYDHLQTNP